MKVLIVDDDLDLIGITAFALEQAGYLVVRATDGEQAVQALRAEAPDIVVLDINLPRRNGFELTAHIREQGATPVIMLTARSDEEDVVRALGLGADDYLTKPFSPKVLVARVRALLRRAGNDADNEIRSGSLTLRPDDLTLDGLPGGPMRSRRSRLGSCNCCSSRPGARYRRIVSSPTCGAGAPAVTGNS